ncbi:hypothetical protein BN1013_02140 [Candidatus Rubidus massiliensis]|nr:hypothetical protein BN1013_02140 [Candidatus Rubidus massiliensis]
MIYSSSNYADYKQTLQINYEELKTRIGQNFTISKVIDLAGEVDCSSGEPVARTGNWLEINNQYLICNKGFIEEKNWGAVRILADGEFKGPFDELGLKIINVFFSEMKEGSIIYINNEKKS